MNGRSSFDCVEKLFFTPSEIFRKLRGHPKIESDCLRRLSEMTHRKVNQYKMYPPISKKYKLIGSSIITL